MLSYNDFRWQRQMVQLLWIFLTLSSVVQTFYWNKFPRKMYYWDESFSQGMGKPFIETSFQVKWYSWDKSFSQVLCKPFSETIYVMCFFVFIEISPLFCILNVTTKLSLLIHFLITFLPYWLSHSTLHPSYLMHKQSFRFILVIMRERGGGVAHFRL